MATDARTSSIEYPDGDGLPMAENTLQYDYITLIKGGLEILFADRPDVFVAGDLLWYPVEGKPKICQAPDVLVAFGRPKGYRGSYKQWEEENIPPQVVFEILSPSNRGIKMTLKFEFYQSHGVEEYYVYDPDDGEFAGLQRSGDKFAHIPEIQGWVSPRLKVRFEVHGGQLQVFGPDGRQFVNEVELARQRDQAERQTAEANRRTAEVEALARKQAEHIQRLQAQLKAQGMEPTNGHEAPPQ
jgi:Uma2 family endonuclease